MKGLSTYVAAILDRESTRAISCKTIENFSWLDQGHEVFNEFTGYRFDDGAVIRRTVERDTFPTGAACAGISPARKVSESACRESFWLAWHSA